MVAFDSQFGPPKEDAEAKAPIEYQLEWTPRGTWKRFDYPDGKRFTEYTSHSTFLGRPFLNYTSGIDPETKRVKTARGFIAIGPRAVGVIAIGQYARGFLAIGQLAIGVFALGQLSIGLCFALGQLAIATAALGQLAIGGACAGQIAVGLFFAAGQFALGYVAMGLGGAGWYAYGQNFFGRHVWDMHHADPFAVEFFKSLRGWFAG